jgi:hypothetical protein
MTTIARRESGRTGECEYSDCETITEGETQFVRQEDSSDELYLLSLLLDVLSLRTELLNEREISVLKDRLVFLLRQLPLKP